MLHYFIFKGRTSGFTRPYNSPPTTAGCRDLQCVEEKVPRHIDAASFPAHQQHRVASEISNCMVTCNRSGMQHGCG